MVQWNNKQKVFIEHISIAEKLGVLDQIKRYIFRLNDKDLCFHDMDELVYEDVGSVRHNLF